MCVNGQARRQVSPQDWRMLLLLVVVNFEVVLESHRVFVLFWGGRRELLSSSLLRGHDSTV